jgi:Baseplate J-like protein
MWYTFIRTGNLSPSSHTLRNTVPLVFRGEGSMSEKNREDEVRAALEPFDRQPEPDQDSEPADAGRDQIPIPAEREEDVEPRHSSPVGEVLSISTTPLEEQEPEQAVTVDRAPGQPLRLLLVPTTAKERIVAGIALYLVLAVVFFDLGQAAYFTFFQTTTVTLLARDQPITTTQTMQLVRWLPTEGKSQLRVRSLMQVTLSQQATGQATGTFHQQPTYAVGSLTFYNGQFSSQTVSKGTIFTSATGIAVITDQAAFIPAGNPPSYGEATVPAHAVNVGEGGNIQAGEINGPCCGSAILVRNTQNFTGGQDAKTYPMVTQSDLDRLSAPLKRSLTQSMQAALNAQVRTGETLLLDSCRAQLTPDRQAGDLWRHFLRHEGFASNGCLSPDCSGPLNAWQRLPPDRTHKPDAEETDTHQGGDAVDGFSRSLVGIPAKRATTANAEKPHCRKTHAGSSTPAFSTAGD